jgi:hypothetical protein
MTHVRTPPPPEGRPPHRPLDGIADPSDLMRQLSDLFVPAPGCRAHGSTAMRMSCICARNSQQDAEIPRRAPPRATAGAFDP